MTNLNKNDLLSLEEYSEKRELLRAEVINLKRNRLIGFPTFLIISSTRYAK